LWLAAFAPQHRHRGQAELAQRTPSAMTSGAEFTAALVHCTADQFRFAGIQHSVRWVVPCLGTGHRIRQDFLDQLADYFTGALIT
jgi:hypothetical protein